MALITCPECGGTVSDSASTCPHCGYQLLVEQTTTTTTNVTNNVVYTNAVHNGYDVMLVDYMKGKLYTAARVQEVLNCSYLEATNLLGNIPCYLYNGLSYSDALYIAQSLQYYGMRIALYDPNGVVTYYAPSGYNRPLPSLLNILRTPLFHTMPPRRHEFVVRRQTMRPAHNEPKRNDRPHMSMPTPNQPRQSSFGGGNNKPATSNNHAMNSNHGGGHGNAGGMSANHGGGNPGGGRGGGRKGR